MTRLSPEEAISLAKKLIGPQPDADWTIAMAFKTLQSKEQERERTALSRTKSTVRRLAFLRPRSNVCALRSRAYLMPFEAERSETKGSITIARIGSLSATICETVEV
jgi:hypothetical protein